MLRLRKVSQVHKKQLCCVVFRFHAHKASRAAARTIRILGQRSHLCSSSRRNTMHSFLWLRPRGQLRSPLHNTTSRNSCRFQLVQYTHTQCILLGWKRQCDIANCAALAPTTRILSQACAHDGRANNCSSRSCNLRKSRWHRQDINMTLGTMECDTIHRLMPRNTYMWRRLVQFVRKSTHCKNCPNQSMAACNPTLQQQLL